MAAIQAATRNAARYLNLVESFGTIETGKTADLVVLDADPLLDIHNTRRIAGVVFGGRYTARAELDRLLAGIEAIANDERSRQ
jgi:imidazolonepropionase-like amidohydrolase